MMRRQASWIALSLGLMAASAAAQTVTGSGTTNTVPVFTGASTIANSPIFVSGSNVGIGTMNPQATLDVQSFSQTQPGVGVNLLNTSGLPESESLTRVLFAGENRTTGFALIQAGGTDWGSGNGFLAFQVAQSGSLAERVRFTASGNVGIGTTSPAYTLDVAGTIRATTGVVFPDGTTQTTAFVPASCGADYAEAVDVTGDRTHYEPGDVLVIDSQHAGKFLKADQAYSTMVAGIYSTKPGFVGRKEPASDPASKEEIPMAMVGRVPTKVSAENGPIHVGDLLVSSSTMGYAMKGTDRSRMLGAVVGKALGSLGSGKGVIEVLVTLQ